MVLGSGRRVVEATDTKDTSDIIESISEGNHDPPRESWVEWVKRTTRTAEQVLGKSNDWCSSWRRRVWRFAYRVATADSRRWTWKAARWMPENDTCARRAPHGPKKRWTDDIISYLKSNGTEADSSNIYTVISSFTAKQWQAMESSYCSGT